MSFVMEVGLGIFLVQSRISDFFPNFPSERQFLCVGTMLEFAVNHLVANVWWKEDYQRYDGVTEPSLRTTWLRVKLSNSTPQEPLVLAVSLNNPQKNRPFRQSWLSWTLKFLPRFRQMCSPTYWSVRTSAMFVEFCFCFGKLPQIPPTCPSGWQKWWIFHFKILVVPTIRNQNYFVLSGWIIFSI